jgi:predicted Rossmann fold nucleotide-binding protein DprA/Smf involved in DNA uptake
MARTRKEMDLKGQARKRYEELLRQRDEIEGELKGIESYLKSVNGIKAPAKGRKTAPVAGPKRGSATESIMSLIGRSEKGVSIDQIIKETGLTRLTVNGVLNRMKKEKKVKAIKRGVYVKA